MTFLKSHKLILFWLILGMPLISYILFQKTFKLSLYGDDWLQLYNLWVSFDVRKELSFFDIKSYLGAYWPQYFFLGIIRHFFGYQASAYFATSLLLRILVSISLFFLVKQLSKNILCSFLATLIFTFSVTGIQTTDWVFNMNTYAGIFFFNLGYIFYLRTRETRFLFSWSYLFFILFLAISLGVVPVRMHGAIPFIIATEVFLYLLFSKIGTLKIDKPFVIRLIIPILIMFTLVKVGSFGSEGDTLQQLRESFQYIQTAIHKGYYNMLFYFLGIIGNIALPDTMNLGTIFNSSYIRILSFIIFDFLIAITIRGRRDLYVLIIVLNAACAVISKLIDLWSPILSSNTSFSISVGFQLFVLSFIIIYQTKRKFPELTTSIVTGLSWIIFFTLLYWLRSPYLVIETTGRYMTMGAVGFSIVFASIISIMINHHKGLTRFIFPFIIVICWLLINYISIQSYLTNLVINRNLTLADKIWKTLKDSVPTLDTTAPSVFYFTYDNSTAANMLLIFGFSPHAGLSYNITAWEKTPIPTEDYQQLLDIVKTGEPMKKRHSRQDTPVPLSRVFAFDLRNGELANTTDLIRQQITKDIIQKD